jgi:hypothetical protein
MYLYIYVIYTHICTLIYVCVYVCKYTYIYAICRLTGKMSIYVYVIFDIYMLLNFLRIAMVGNVCRYLYYIHIYIPTIHLYVLNCIIYINYMKFNYDYSLNYMYIYVYIYIHIYIQIYAYIHVYIYMNTQSYIPA